MLPPIMLIKDCFHKAQTKEEMSTNLKSHASKYIVSLGALVLPPKSFIFQGGFEWIAEDILLTWTFFASKTEVLPRVPEFI